LESVRDFSAERESEQIACLPGIFNAILTASWIAISSLERTDK